MRAIVSGVVAAGLLISQAQAATVCARPAEKTAFDVVGLKSQLMVTALSCAAQDKYNAFIQRFRASLVLQDRAVAGYFGRQFGKRGQAQHDDYVTSLANAQSEAGTKLGNQFCVQRVAMFDEVMALNKPTDLPGYAAGKELVQPIALTACPITIRTTRTTRSTSSRHKKIRS